jgi:hypothetical protein
MYTQIRRSHEYMRSNAAQKSFLGAKERYRISHISFRKQMKLLEHFETGQHWKQNGINQGRVLYLCWPTAKLCRQDFSEWAIGPSSVLPSIHQILRDYIISLFQRWLLLEDNIF